MAELKESRKETEQTRQEMGAVDLKPGEQEGMREESAPGTVKSRAMEKRKREIEERRKDIEAKRRKLKGKEDDEPEVGPPEPPKQAVEPASSQNADPFAALEAQSPPSRKDKGKAKQTATSGTSAADDFLAQLERELMGKR